MTRVDTGRLLRYEFAFATLRLLIRPTEEIAVSVGRVDEEGIILVSLTKIARKRSTKAGWDVGYIPMQVGSLPGYN